MERVASCLGGFGVSDVTSSCCHIAGCKNAVAARNTRSQGAGGAPPASVHIKRRSSGLRVFGLAETHQREMTEWRDQAPFGGFAAVGCCEPFGVARPGEFGGAEAGPAHDRLQRLLDEAAQALVGADAREDD